MTIVGLEGFAFSYIPEGDGLYQMFDPDGGGERLVAVAGGFAYIIETKNDFSSYRTSSLDHPAIFVPGLSIEVDILSAFNTDSHGVAYGSISRRAERASLHLKFLDRHNMPYTHKLDIASGLDAVPAGNAVAFSKWSIGWGAGEQRRILFSFDIPRATSLVR